ncbi:uncharacterized protein KY384_001676 [Bacidia gigantensis]|uniref:uncharacterized protein n=1 Tax=Bacidia gigantensis TaxID=2732470 RepID=UPI001D05B41F|nr:uncharacterized protein KY384_001676 [Bacidia gigantensis]KAG8533935.1 hypothetical protein KY384_001676 [Bacidia gigantensis]
MALSLHKHSFRWVLAIGILALLLSPFVVTQDSLSTGSKSLKSRAVSPISSEIVNPIAKVGIRFGIPDGNLTLSAHVLEKRDYWDDSVANGRKKLDLLDGQTKQTPLNKLDDLEANGWSYGSDPLSQLLFGDAPWTSIFSELGVDGDEMADIVNKQNQPFSNCQFENIPATNGEYINRYSFDGRMILANSNFAPHAVTKDHAANSAIPDVPYYQRMPLVEKWSSIVGIVATHIAEANTKNLKYVVRAGILTDATQDIINGAAKRHDRGQNPRWLNTDWPGIDFSRNDEAYFALTGTAHGVGVVYLLKDHPDQFGDKRVDSIKIWKNYSAKESPSDERNTGEYEMMFTLTN